MIDLGQTYAKAGLFLAEGELPDYLPAVLEFVSTQPPAEARAFLGEMVHIFNAIFGSLIQRRSPYASVLGALIELAGEKAQSVEPTAEDEVCHEGGIGIAGCYRCVECCGDEPKLGAGPYKGGVAVAK